jgi:hypothetical protein
MGMNSNSTPNYKALCFELLQFGDQAGEIAANEGLWPDCDPGPDWLLDRARAALEAQPEPQGPSRPAIEPVLVSERLPGPTDCDAEGQCWWWDEDDDMWRLSEHRPWLLCWTHWLPRWALPVPAPANTIDQNNY